jgi:hypothetical protein
VASADRPGVVPAGDVHVGRDLQDAQLFWERMVEEKRGTLKLDLSEWSLAVHSPGGGRVHARLRVTPAGLNDVRR